MKIIMFFGLIPDAFLQNLAIYNGPDEQLGANTIIPIPGSSLIKSNGIFLSEPSVLSAMTALGILIEILEFRRPRYLILLALGLLLSYSGTGILILLFTLPLTALVHTRAQLPAVLVVSFALTLIGTGIIDASVFTSRIGEFEDVNTSGFQRFISSFWMTAEHFDTASLQALIRGNGPAAMKEFVHVANYGSLGNTWFKLLYEYGLIGALIFTGFLASCFRASWCPKPLMVALIYSYLFGADNLINTYFLTIMVVLCTLSGPAPRIGRVDELVDSRASLVLGRKYADHKSVEKEVPHLRTTGLGSGQTRLYVSNAEIEAAGHKPRFTRSMTASRELIKGYTTMQKPLRERT